MLCTKTILKFFFSYDNDTYVVFYVKLTFIYSLSKFSDFESSLKRLLVFLLTFCMCFNNFLSF